MPQTQNKTFHFEPSLIPILYIFGRIIFYLGMVSNGLFGFGDVQRYFQVAALNGWPFFSYWVEYPPLFPFLCTLIYHLVGGQELAFEAAIYFILTLAGSASIFVFMKLEQLLFTAQTGYVRTWVILSFLLVLSYSWWYFEMIPVALFYGGYGVCCRKKNGSRAGSSALAFLQNGFQPCFFLRSGG